MKVFVPLWNVSLYRIQPGLYGVVNTPILVEQTEDKLWNAFIPMDGEDKWTITVGVKTKGEILKEIKEWLANVFKAHIR